MKAWRRSWIVGAAAIAWAAAPAAAQLTQISAMTVPNVEVDFDLMPAGPTHQTTIRDTFPRANLGGILLSLPTAGEGVYDTNVVGRALAGDPATPTGGWRGWYVVDATGSGAFGAFGTARFHLRTTATQFGFNIGDWNGLMNIAVESTPGGFSGDLQVSVSGGQNVFVESAVPFSAINLTLHAIANQPQISTQGNWVIPTLFFETSPTLSLCYDVVDLGNGLFEYSFVGETDFGWAPGMGWRWFIFGDERSVAAGGTGTSPLTSFSMTSPVPGPWTGLSSSGGGHNGPTFTPVLDYWVPTLYNERLEWSGTSDVRLNPGELLFSTIAGTIGGAVAADFKVATEGCACPCACNWDPDPVCNIFDFLAFQTAFVAREPCACNMDPGRPCDIFDFLAFQLQFVQACR